MNDKEIKFLSHHRKARCAPNPDYPFGIAIPPPPGVRVACLVELPYPAPECGLWSVHCNLCGNRTLITAAGRYDDPVSVQLECLTRKGGNA